ncbi:HAMP domain-containing protein [Pseudophaeobacter leonis]|uniref:HAMP domain-containing protein n=1 Tax=Pseudophaeobacter leonis TaxID=1144477 RepID=UPI00111C5726|nr:methyl-accepting chemotaxis protein [Pseudophaeobacter leonis]
MFRNMPINTRLLISGITAVSSIVFLASLSIYSLWQSELELERQISVTEAVRQELNAGLESERMEGVVVYSLLQGEQLSAADQAALAEQLVQESQVFMTSLKALQAVPTSPEISALAEITIPLAEEFIVSSQAIQTLGFQDNGAALAALPAFFEERALLKKDLHTLQVDIAEFARTSALAARAHDMNLLYSLLGISALTILVVLHNARKTTLTITRPIERLRIALRDVAEGNFEIRISDRMRQDDFGEIAHDIDLVTARVVETLAEQDARRAVGEGVIARLGSGLQNLSKGNFSDRIAEVFDDEYEPLRVDYNGTVDNLNELISKVVLASKGIQGRSSEIQDASEDLSTRTASQAATLEETAAALEQMATSVTTAAQNTKEVEDAMAIARSDVEHSGRVVEGAIGGDE